MLAEVLLADAVKGEFLLAKVTLMVALVSEVVLSKVWTLEGEDTELINVVLKELNGLES